MKDFHLSKKELDFLPTESQVIEYERIGWYTTQCIIPNLLIEKAISGAEAFYVGKEDFTLFNNEGIADDNQSENTLRNNEFVTLRKREIQELGFYPLISAIAAKLSRTSEIRLFADSLIKKSPASTEHKGIVGWHSDKAYWPTCSSNHMLTAWIPFQDCTIDMGTLTHIDSSHKWKDEKDLKGFYSFNNQNLDDFTTYLSKEKQGFKPSPMLLRKGQVSFHNCNTIHSSTPNVSNKNRFALAVHLQDASNHYQKAYKETGEPIAIGYDKICSKDVNGDPDYADEKLFPVLWKANQ